MYDFTFYKTRHWMLCIVGREKRTLCIPEHHFLDFQMSCGDAISQNHTFGIEITHSNLGVSVCFCGSVGLSHKPSIFDAFWIHRVQNVEEMLFKQSIPLLLNALARCFFVRFTSLIDATPTRIYFRVEASHTSASVLNLKFTRSTLVPLFESDFLSVEHTFSFFVVGREPLPFLPGLTHSSMVSRAKAMYSESVSISINW